MHFEMMKILKKIYTVKLVRYLKLILCIEESNICIIDPCKGQSTRVMKI